MACQRAERHDAGYPSQSSTAAVDVDGALGLGFGLSISEAVSEETSVHTVSLSEEAYLLLCILRKEGETDGRAVQRSLESLDAYRIVEKALKSRELRKAFVCARQLRGQGFGDESTTAMCRALFGAQSEKDLRSAFGLLDVDESGFIDKDELRRALPIMSEEVSEKSFEKLFRLVDADGSGLIDFEEFTTLVRGFNPKLRDGAENPFKEFQEDAQGSLELVGEVLSSAAAGATSTVSALSTAFGADLPGISPLEMRKAGAVLKNMREAGYSDKMAEAICRALFCEQSEKQLQRAYKFYDTDRSGFLDAVEFRQALPLMGEKVPEERINELFRKAAVDESGNINFAEFCKLVKAMNPKKKKKASQEPDVLYMFRDAASRVASTWAAKTKDLQDAEEEPDHRKSPQRRKGGAPNSSVASEDSSGAATAETSPKAATATGSSSAHNSAGRVITLPPKSQRVSIQRYDGPF